MYKRELDLLFTKEALPNALFLYGDSPYLLSRYSLLLARYWEKRGDVIRIDFDEYRFETLKSTLAEPSLFSDASIVILRSEAKLAKKEIETLAKLALSHTGSIFIFISFLESRDAREYEKYFSAKGGESVRFFEPSPYEARGLLQIEAAERGLRLSETLLTHLYGLHGGNLALTCAELDKLGVLDEEIDIRKMESLVYGLESYNGDDLAKALILKKDVEKIIENLLEQGIAETELIMGLQRYFHQLTLFIMAMKTSGPLSDSKGVLGFALPKPLFEERLALAKRVPFMRYENIMDTLLEGEKLLKTTKEDTKAVLYGTLLRLKTLL